MSDFLTSLAARALMPVPAIRPVVGSLYEPRAAVESPLPVSVTTAVPVQPTFSPAPVAPRSSAGSEPRLPAPESSPHVSEGGSLPHPFTRAVATSEAPAHIHSVPVSIPAPPVPRGRKAKRPQPAPQAVEGAPSPLSPPAARPVPATATPRPAIFPAASPSPRPADPVSPVVSRVAQETPGESGLPAAPVPVTRPAQSPRAPEGTRLPRIFPPQRSPLGAAASEKSPSIPAAAPASSPAPEVTITIGRVEIRAAVPAAPAPAPAAAKPHLSLEAYLRRSASRTA
jgi:hypothetical protein